MRTGIQKYSDLLDPDHASSPQLAGMTVDALKRHYRSILKAIKAFCGTSQRVSTCVTLAPDGPWPHQATSFSRSGRGPSATPSTEPSAEFLTQPVKPSSWARCIAEARK